VEWRERRRQAVGGVGRALRGRWLPKWPCSEDRFSGICPSKNDRLELARLRWIGAKDPCGSARSVARQYPARPLTVRLEPAFRDISRPSAAPLRSCSTWPRGVAILRGATRLPCMHRTAAITYKATTKSILDLSSLHQNEHLNLKPGFQRQSVWAERDRARLIDSILRNYPLPAIFLYKRADGGHLVFDVIDGKQRLESIFMFMGQMRGRFATKTQLLESESVESVDWARLKGRGLQHRLTGYEIPVIEVDGELGDIINVFVRINSTGKALTRQEQRHARYYDSEFLKEAARLARRFESYFLGSGIFSAGQISRMKHVELVCELMLSLVQGDVLNKKTALDRVMATSSFDGRQLGKASRMVTATLNRVRRMFPQLKTTRLRQVTDFYTLAARGESRSLGNAKPTGFVGV
jgi:Protein of unknown function DUF262